MLGITTSLIIFVGAVAGVPDTMPMATVDTSMMQVLVPPKEEREGDVEATNPVTLETYVRQYFSDTPVLAEIARCESTFRHLNKNGKVLQGVVYKRDVGVMQINKYYHSDDAKKLGLDLHELDDNLAYAKWLFEKKGAKPWKASSKCWMNSNLVAMK